ncbi:MAG: MxaD family protein [marine bacterium B5-7]|nr:MAG: MxaD family protein [marine bacterium B5-7]
MSDVTVTNNYPVSPEKVWELIGGFNALPQWHPAVEKSELEEGGSIRRLKLAGGAEIVERLEKQDDNEYSYTYSIVDSPLPVANYSATIKLEDDGKGGCKATWSGHFEASGAPENDAMKIIEGIYQSGFANLGKLFGS